MKTSYYISLFAAILFTFTTHAQDSLSMEQLKERIRVLELTELVQSMTQRSLLIPGYQSELKALIACQAFNFWQENEGEKFVSHLNVYSALHYANKYLRFDSTIMDYAYNQILGHSEMVVSVELGSDPSYFYSAGSDGKVFKWNLNDPRAIPEMIYEVKGLIRSIDVSDDDHWLMVVTKNAGLAIIDLQKGRLEMSQPLLDKEPVQAAAFLPGKDAYLTVTKKGEIKLAGYDYDSTAIGQSTSKILSVAISSEDYQFYLGSEAGHVKKMDKSGDEKRIVFQNAYAINAMDISPDNKMLAVGRELGDAIIWDIEKKEPIRIISGHQSAVTDVEFSPDNKVLLTSSRDGTARLWDMANTKKLPTVLDDHGDWVMTAAYDKSGDRIITGSKDNFIRIWEVNARAMAQRICELVDRNLTEEEWSEYVGDHIPYQQTCPLD